MVFRRKASKHGSRKRRNKAKSRQQKLSVKTVESIAKRVAGRLDNKKNTPLKDVITFGLQMASLEEMTMDLPEGDSLCMAGCYDVATRDRDTETSWGPKLQLVEADSGAYPVIDLNDGDRISNNIFLKGIQIRGTFILPSTLHRATCHFTICKKRGPKYASDAALLDVPEFIPNPWLYNYKSDLEYGTMNILDDYEVHLRQGSGRKTGNDAAYSNLYRTVDRYFSINKQVEYEDFALLTDPLTPAVDDFVKTPYEFRLWSDQTKAIKNDGTLEDNDHFPQFQGRVIYHYSAT